MFMVTIVVVTRTIIRFTIVSLPMKNEFLGILGIDKKYMFYLLQGISLRCNELIHVPFDLSVQDFYKIYQCL
jgi:hypothetical protein